MIVGELLTDRLSEHRAELGEIVGSSDRNNTFDLTVVLFDGHPTVTDEEEPTSNIVTSL